MLMLLVIIKERTVLHQIKSSLGQWCAIKKTLVIMQYHCLNYFHASITIMTPYSNIENLIYLKQIHWHSYTGFHMEGKEGGMTSDIAQSSIFILI